MSRGSLLNPNQKPEARIQPCGLIFGDDRVGSEHVELVAEAGLDLVFLQPTVPVKEFVRLQPSQIPIPDSTEIGEAVFRTDRPIVGDGIFDSAADRPADTGVRTAG